MYHIVIFLGHKNTDLFLKFTFFNNREQEIDQVILNLEMTWKKFLNCASSSATDFLSIDHLGMILDLLYQTGMIYINKDISNLKILIHQCIL